MNSNTSILENDLFKPLEKLCVYPKCSGLMKRGFKKAKNREEAAFSAI